jgi:hypothetical protein
VRAELGARATQLERVEAKELLELVLLRAAAMPPLAVSRAAMLEAPPRWLWFTVRTSRDRSGLGALTDASLLEESRWLEENELLAQTARAWLGATVGAVVATLRAAAHPIAFSAPMRALLERDGQPLPSARATQLLVLGGGGPALRFLEGALGTASGTIALHSMDAEWARQAVTLNTVAGDYARLRETTATPRATS